MKKIGHESFPELLQSGSSPFLSYSHRKRLNPSRRQKSENLLQKYNDRMQPSNSLGRRVLIKSAIADRPNDVANSAGRLRQSSAAVATSREGHRSLGSSVPTVEGQHACKVLVR